MKIRFLAVFFLAVGYCFAGPYVEPGRQAQEIGSDANSWATGCVVLPGYQDISDPSFGYAWYGYESDALGYPGSTVYGVVSLGDGGVATVTFDSEIYITNGAGDDFVVFENGFDVNGDTVSFLELGFVEVSSDGVNFFRFEPISLTPTNVQVGTFDGIDSTDIYNLAGKHVIGGENGFDPDLAEGTGFDLEELKDVSPLLDVNSVSHVRIIDVVGYVEPADIYGDGVVNFIDFSFFADSYYMGIGDDGFNLDCDIVEDGFVDEMDLSIFFAKRLSENDYSSCDANGHQINDPWPTPFDSSGFDLEAVGILNKRLRD